MTAMPPKCDPLPPPRPGVPFRFTREQYGEMGRLGFFRDQRVELIRGEVLTMSPPKWPHSLSVGLVAEALRAAFYAGHWVNSRSPFRADDETEPEPDVAVIPGTIRHYTDHPATAVPAVEVADSSLFYDTSTKAEVYATARVPDYWVLDLEHRRLVVCRDPAPLPAGLGGSAYRSRTELTATDTVSPLADLLP